ncbi:GNAT family N-acetyltransferase [Streptacidiphilus sp. PAMC 29251]
MEIRKAEPGDLPGVLAMMDGTVEWLVAQGRTGQWGSEPWSTRPALVERVAGRIERGEALVAVLDGALAGVVSVSEAAASYVRPAGEPELYVNLLATERRLRSQGVGGALLDRARAEARSRGIGLLRVDCYAGDDGKLKSYYRGQGFTEVEPFTVSRPGEPDWPGMLLAQRLD